MRKTLLFSLIVLSGILALGCLQQISGQGDGELTTYGPAEISSHNSRTDCWLVIGDGVYDVTNFIPTHPGGNEIVQGCGTNATELFETRSMGSGTPHSINARNLLSSYYIGRIG